MPSPAHTNLLQRLKDADELLAARDHICPKKSGKPAKRQGAAILRAGTVMLSAAIEVYVEEIFDAAVDLVFAHATETERNSLKKNTSERLNNASVFKIDLLYFNLGIPWVMQSTKLNWKNCKNEKVRKRLDALVTARNQISHGGSPSVTKTKFKSWREFVEQFPRKFDEIIADWVQKQVGVRPW